MKAEARKSLKEVVAARVELTTELQKARDKLGNLRMSSEAVAGSGIG